MRRLPFMRASCRSVAATGERFRRRALAPEQKLTAAFGPEHSGRGEIAKDAEKPEDRAGDETKRARSVSEEIAARCTHHRIRPSTLAEVGFRLTMDPIGRRIREHNAHKRSLHVSRTRPCARHFQRSSLGFATSGGRADLLTSSKTRGLTRLVGPTARLQICSAVAEPLWPCSSASAFESTQTTICI